MKSRYPAAAQAIRTWIHGGALEPGSPVPTGDELATRLGVNRMIALRACQHLVAEGLLRRQGRKLFVRSTELDASPPLGVVYAVSYLPEFCRQVARFLSGRVDLRLVELKWNKHPHLAPVLKRVSAEKPAGIILHASQWDEKVAVALKTGAIPTVVCGRCPPGFSAAGVDFYQGAEKALAHLHKLGHRHIACLEFGDNEQLVECFRMLCFKLNMKSSAVWRSEWDREEARKTMVAERKRHPEVTALLSNDLGGIWATELFSVPQEISVIGFGGIPATRTSHPPLTTIEVTDSECAARWACTEMMAQLEAIASGRPRRPTTRARFEPHLLVRQSTRALRSMSVRPKIEMPATTEADQPAPEKTWQEVYPFLRALESPEWRQLDLSPLANHSMMRQHGWLGADPLEYFLPGLRSIHGVPFLVLDEGRNDGRAVITFRSPRSHSAGEKELPTTVHVPVHGRVKALYFLHGCAYAAPLPFAEYVMHRERGQSSRLPLVPLGPPRRTVPRHPGGLKPNLQDWWTGYPQRNFPHAHYLTVYNPADPAVYERTLYSLEWINPRPDDEISLIEVRVDPNAGPALALISITALL